MEYKIIANVGEVSKCSTEGWNLEFNIVKWGKNPMKIDIRSWNNEHTRMGKGITLTTQELEKIMELYTQYKTDIKIVLGEIEKPKKEATLKKVEKPKKVVVVKKLTEIAK